MPKIVPLCNTTDPSFKAHADRCSVQSPTCSMMGPKEFCQDRERPFSEPCFVPHHYLYRILQSLLLLPALWLSCWVVSIYNEKRKYVGLLAEGNAMIKPDAG